MVVNIHLETGVWGLLGGVICIHSVTFSLMGCFSHQPDPRWSVFARSVWFLYTCFSFFFFFLFQLIQIWVNLTKWLSFESGRWPICHQTSFLCFYHAAESREENKDTVGWWSIIWSDSHHEVWAFWNDAPSVYFLLFFIMLDFFCVFFPLPISAFCLGLHLLCSSYSNKTQLLPFCQSLGTGWSFWGLCFMCFAWPFIGKRFFIYLIYWRGTLPESSFAVAVSFLILKKFTLFTSLIFQLNFNITNVFSLAKQNLFYILLYHIWNRAISALGKNRMCGGSNTSRS